MKILYSAFMANPYAGSEAQCGWSWAYAMREYNDVYLITAEEHRPAITKYLKENNINNITVFYHDVPDWINIYKKTGKLYFPYYIFWQKLLYKKVKKLHEEYHFDYIQHVTIGDFRLIGPLSKLDADFFFGPVGGGQLTPKPFEVYVKTHKRSEKFRELINRSVRFNPSYRRSLNRAKYVFAANKETHDYLASMMKHPERCILLTENGIMRDKIAPLEQKEKGADDTINVLWSGRMMYRKGLDFLLESFSLMESERKIKLLLLGDGSENEHLKQRVKELGLTDKVTFLGRVPYTMVDEIYRKVDIFVFPSLRETTGTVLFESLSYGIPIVCFNQNGADLLVDDTCGIKVDINQELDKIKADFCNAIKKLAEDDELRKRLGKNGYEKIINEYTWQIKCHNFNEKYLSKD